MENKNKYRYTLKVGYGDYHWDRGEDEFNSNSLEELWLEVPSDMTKEEFMRLMEEDGYADDEDEMWYAIDNETL